MALIHCPECNHEISDTAKSCPNCGFLLQTLTTSPQIPANNYFSPSGTQLPPYKRNIPGGIGLLILLIFMIPVTGIGFSFFVIPGILFAIGDVLIFWYMGVCFSESRTCICPYCGGKIIDTKNNAGISALKCPSCKKTSAIINDVLKPLE